MRIKRSWTVALKLGLGAWFALALGCGEDDGARRKNADAGESDDAGETSGDAGAGDLTRVKIASGELQGDVVGGSIRFLKIPFAKPPVGDLRWKAPEPNEPWSGVRHETEFASPCPQSPSEQVSDGSTNEDCLYLNVWRPAEAKEGAPVMVWIHGGGNVSGSAADEVPTSQGHLWYDGQFFAERHGIVVVTLNYRLGAFGFFAHPALADEGSPVGNQGLLDQNLALKWVQDNIAAFGGDPSNVTIFGESAGSADVCLHVVSPKSRGLFHRAISQSGGCTVRPRNPDPAVVLVEWATERGCTGDDVLSCLRAKRVDELISLERTARGDGALAPRIFNIVADGDFLPAPPAELFERGDVAKVPYILGSNTEEGMLYFFSAMNLPTNDEEYLAALTESYGSFAERIVEVYPASRFDGDYRRTMARVYGDATLVCGTHDTARRAAAAGLDVYMYNFNIPWSISRAVLGPTHASEISHVFGSPYNETDESIAVSDAMNAYWAQFARSGDPNYEGAPQTWPRFEPTAQDDDLRIQFDPDYEILESFRKDECALWREYAASQEES